MSKRMQLDADDLEFEASNPEPKNVECPTGKYVFFTISRASKAAKSMRRYKQDSFLEHYHCEQCGHYHVGHAIGTKQRRKDLVQFTG